MHIGEVSACQPFARYTILAAEGGVVGSFDSVASDFAFVTSTQSCTAKKVSLEFSRDTLKFPNAAVTASQRANAAAAEGSWTGSCSL